MAPSVVAEALIAAARRAAGSTNSERVADVVGQPVAVLGEVHLSAHRAVDSSERVRAGDRDESNGRATVARDDDVLNGPGALDELGEIRLGVVDLDLCHGTDGR